MGSSSNFFAWLARAVIRFPKHFIGGMVVLTLFALMSATQLVVDPNIIKLLPKDEPATKELLRINEEEGGTHFFKHLITRRKHGTTRGKNCTDCCSSAEKSNIDYVLYNLSDVHPKHRLQLALMRASSKDLSQLDVRLQQAIALGPSMLSPMIASSLFDLGPLSDRIAQSNSFEEGNLCLSKLRDEKAECTESSQIIIRPNGSPFDNDFAIPFMNEVHSILDELNLEESGIEVAWIGGAYRHAVEDVEVVIYDVSRTAILSFSLVLVLISLVYERSVRC